MDLARFLLKAGQDLDIRVGGEGLDQWWRILTELTWQDSLLKLGLAGPS